MHTPVARAVRTCRTTAPPLLCAPLSATASSLVPSPCLRAPSVREAGSSHQGLPAGVTLGGESKDHACSQRRGRREEAGGWQPGGAEVDGRSRQPQSRRDPRTEVEWGCLCSGAAVPSQAHRQADKREAGRPEAPAPGSGSWGWNGNPGWVRIPAGRQLQAHSRRVHVAVRGALGLRCVAEHVCACRA